MQQGDGNLEKVEASLAKARTLIKQALLRTNDIVPLEDSHDYIPQGDIYRNAFAFHRNYVLPLCTSIAVPTSKCPS
ncbi:putative glycosyltransferase [Trifolium pratense]|uniref:Putative glycosyltransferase n=1 Tax=Trifolium pratense TaxID=57577 RepID=A0A2K3LYB1_TRIPR|nr:putative glycosyltransferase [Trifolium pratense]